MSMTRQQKEAVLIGFYLDGKKAEYRVPNQLARDEWAPWPSETLHFSAWDYRLKPEPVAGWFVIDGCGRKCEAASEQSARELALRWDRNNPSDAPSRPIYMRECDPPEEGK